MEGGTVGQTNYKENASSGHIKNTKAHWEMVTHPLIPALRRQCLRVLSATLVPG